MRNPIAVMSISVFCGLAALVGVVHAMWKDYSGVYTLIYVLLAGGFIIVGILAGIDVAHIKHKAEVFFETLDESDESRRKTEVNLAHRVEHLEETIARYGIASPSQPQDAQSEAVVE